MPTILQLSDAHVSPRTGLFRDNLALVAAAARALGPELVIATGDLSLDGADREEDMACAAELHAALPGPALTLAGNHDIGSDARMMPTQPVNDERLARYRRHFGPARWMRDLAGWRVIGLDSEVMGTGHRSESEQAAFIAEAAAGVGDRRIALFLHKPVFVTSRGDPAFDVWSVPPEGRGALAPILDHPGLRLVASGHLHLHHEFTEGRVRYVWAPPLSFLVNPREQVGLPGARLCAALLHRLHEDHVTTELVQPEGIVTVWLDDVRSETYPAPGG